MSLWTATCFFLLGLFLSAFFSGSETGFYRSNRVRLLLEARTGDRIAAVLLWLTNRPTLFVGSTLVGNNLANYLTSFAIVVAVRHVELESPWGELAATLAISPVVFVYGELMPKSLFFRAPNRLLRLGGPLLVACVVIFSPLAAFLWGLGWIIQQWLGEMPMQFQQSVARHELQRMLQEGHDAGLLKAAQQRVSRNLFRLATRPVAGFAAAAHRVCAIELHAPKSALLEPARRRGLTAAPVRDPENPDHWLGYVRIIDLYLSDAETIDTYRSLPEIPASESHLAALMRLQEQGEEMAQLVNDSGASIGVVYASDLREPIFRHA